MGSAVGSRPNHYEMLGLRPTASAEEIAQAFARAMRFPHVVSELAQIGVAFDTLRNAAKRRAYDERLGIRPHLQKRAAPAAMSFRVSARLAAIAADRPLEPPPASRSTRPSGMQMAPQLPLEQKLQSSISQSGPPRVRPAAPASIVLPQPDREPRREGDMALDRGSRIEDIFALRGDAHDAQAISSRRTAIIASVLVVAVALVGAWAGTHVKGSGAPRVTQSGLTAPVPVPRPDPARIVDPAAQASQEPRLKAFAAPAPPAGNAARHGSGETHGSRAPFAAISQSLDAAPSGSGSAEGTSSEASAQAPAAPVAAANLPLPSAVIARTLERIGYACGEIASASAGNTPGAYKITCTSGQSYQAKPVHGRYRFRRL